MLFLVLAAAWNPGGTLVEPWSWWNEVRAAPDHPGAYLGRDPKAFSCWGKIRRTDICASQTNIYKLPCN